MQHKMTILKKMKNIRLLTRQTNFIHATVYSSDQQTARAKRGDDRQTT